MQPTNNASLVPSAVVVSQPAIRARANPALQNSLVARVQAAFLSASNVFRFLTGFPFAFLLIPIALLVPRDTGFREVMEKAINIWVSYTFPTIDSYSPSIPAVVTREDRLLVIDELKGAFQNLGNLWPKLSEEESRKLAKFLLKIQRTADYRKIDNHNGVVDRLNQFFQLACENEFFRKTMNDYISDSIDNCSDRAQDGLNRIEIEWQLYQDMSTEQAKDLCIRAAKYDFLNNFAANLPGNSAESVETALQLTLQMKKELNLPISMKKMDYRSYSSLLEADIPRVRELLKKKTPEELLASSPYWQNYVTRRNQVAVEQINQKYVDLLSIAERFDQEGESVLSESPEFKAILDSFLNSKDRLDGPISYLDLVKFISEKRKIEIAAISV